MKKEKEENPKITEKFYVKKINYIKHPIWMIDYFYIFKDFVKLKI